MYKKVDVVARPTKKVDVATLLWAGATWDPPRRAVGPGAKSSVHLPPGPHLPHFLYRTGHDVHLFIQGQPRRPPFFTGRATKFTFLYRKGHDGPTFLYRTGHDVHLLYTFFKVDVAARPALKRWTSRPVLYKEGGASWPSLYIKVERRGLSCMKRWTSWRVL